MKIEKPIHIDEFQRINKANSMLWMTSFYLINVLLAFFTTLINKSLMSSQVFIGSSAMRLIIIALLIAAYFWISKKKWRLVEYSIMIALLFSCLNAIIFPPSDPFIAILSFTITLIFLLFMVTILHKNLIIIAVTFVVIIIATILFTLSYKEVSLQNFNQLQIALFYLLILIFLYTVIMVNGTNKVFDYLKSLVYLDLKTGLNNQLQFEFAVSEAIKFGEQFFIIAVDFRNLLDLNRQYGYKNTHPIFLNNIQALTQKITPYAKLYKLEGPTLAMIIFESSFNFADLNDVLNNRYTIQEHSIQLEYQWFGTSFPADGSCSETLIENIYNLKYTISSTSDTVKWFDLPSFEKAKRLIALEKDIADAIEHEDIDIVIQPKLSLKSWLPYGAEVLARWNHPIYGNISPIEFIPMAENLGLINKLTSVIIKKTKAVQGQLAEPLVPHNRMAVNVSAASIADGSIKDLLIGANANFEIEMTESIMMELTDLSKEIMNFLKCQGFTLSMDDFGTGFSNLEYLHEIDIDTLKIDKKFINSMTTSEKALKLVEAIIGMAHILDITVIAEGVETQDQLDQLVLIDCDIIQGYYFKKPMTPEQYIEFCQDRQIVNFL